MQLSNGVLSLLVMEECESTSTDYPEWIPFDGANARFVRTPADSRLPAPVLIKATPAAQASIVLPPVAQGRGARKRQCVMP